jgi:uncharacterized protein YlxW (UPF0749 family)
MNNAPLDKMEPLDNKMEPSDNTSVNTMEEVCETSNSKILNSDRGLSTVVKCCYWERAVVRNIPLLFGIFGIICGLSFIFANIFYLNQYYQIVPSATLVLCSIILLILGTIAKQIQRQVDRFSEQNDEFAEHLDASKQGIKNLQAENEKLKLIIIDFDTTINSLKSVNAEVTNNNKQLAAQLQTLNQDIALEKTNLLNLEKQNDVLADETKQFSSLLCDERNNLIFMKKNNLDLLTTKIALEKSIHNFSVENAKLSSDVRELFSNNAKLLENNTKLSTNITLLEKTNNDLNAEVRELNKLIISLRTFQKKSVELIQVLSLYGDEAKKTGISLHEVAQDLLKTDHSLHDNVEALGIKLQILDKLINK